MSKGYIRKDRTKTFTKKELVSEHEKLVEVLKKDKKKGIRRQYLQQSKELQSYKKL